ncbi:MAG: hypothetical protein AAGJ87_13235, partial [Pseudomonadota bacterium]
ARDRRLCDRGLLMARIRARSFASDARLDAAPDRFSPSAEAVRRSAAAQAFERTQGPSLLRHLRRNPIDDDFVNAVAFGDDDAISSLASSQITREEANERYAAPGLDFTSFGDGALIPEHLAAELQGIKRRENLRSAILANNQRVSGVELFAIGAAATFADPVTLATAFVPAAWIGRAGFLARGGFASRAAARASVGAAEGFAFGAASEAIVLPILQSEGRDYDLGDSLAVVAFSTILGGALAPGLGALGDAISGAPGRGAAQAARDLADVPALREPEDVVSALGERLTRRPVDDAVKAPIDRRAAAVRAEAFGKAIDDVASGRPVDVVPLMRRIGQEEGIVPPGARILDQIGDQTPTRPIAQAVDDIEASPLQRLADDDAAPIGQPAPTPARSFADDLAEPGPTAPVARPGAALGEGTPAEQIARLDHDLADIRAVLDDEVRAGRLTTQDVAAAREEVRLSLGDEGPPRLAADEVEAAYAAAARCIGGA